ncbi:MAG: ABC transporter permease [Desulfobacterales bacterium]|nr:ABC transporter permease [Desulfobacterales bacterium]MDX2510220.1 ABC transporter permease [Desulfobacterales bacterium]
MNINSTHFMPRRLGLLITFGLATLAMLYLSYTLPRLLPGDFITAMYASSPVTLSAEQEAEMRAFYTEDPGFCNYLLKLVKLDWGYSYAFLTPVSALFFEALPWTLLLFGTAHIISISIGFIAGVEASWRQGSKMEKGLVGGMTFLEGIPEISTGVILLVIFALNLRWFPAAGAETTYANVSFTAWVVDVSHHLVLPLATLVLAYIPGNFLLTRNSMIMVIKAPFITTARAKGLPKRRIRYAHAARNALLPLVTRFGLRLAFMVTGVLVVEKIYSYPGLGTLLFNAIQVRDLPVIQAVVLISSLMVLTIILILEFVYRIIDPRLEYAR